MTVPDFSLHKHFFLNIKLTNPKFPTLKKKLPNQNETKIFFHQFHPKSSASSRYNIRENKHENVPRYLFFINQP